MANIKTSTYSNLERYDVPRTPPPFCYGLSPACYNSNITACSAMGATQQCKWKEREDFGAFSLQAAVRYPYGACYFNGGPCPQLTGVT